MFVAFITMLRVVTGRPVTSQTMTRGRADSEQQDYEYEGYVGEENILVADGWGELLAVQEVHRQCDDDHLARRGAGEAEEL